MSGCRSSLRSSASSAAWDRRCRRSRSTAARPWPSEEGSSSRSFDEVNLQVSIHRRERADDSAGPQRDLQDADAVGDLLVAPLGKAPVDLVELAVDTCFDLVELLVD